MNESCQYYRTLSSTYKSPDSPADPSYHPAARLIEWCEHPRAVYPRKETSPNLPCGGDVKKCTFFFEGDRKKYPRFSNALPIEYRRLDSSRVSLDYTTNISEGGLMVSLAEQMAVGERLRLKIFFVSGRNLRSLDAIAVTGKVIWVNPDVGRIGHYRTGMEFEDISSKDLESLKRFLNHFGDHY
jgi:Tfp pilus assembly protein PilZ